FVPASFAIIIISYLAFFVQGLQPSAGNERIPSLSFFPQAFSLCAFVCTPRNRLHVPHATPFPYHLCTVTQES
ncbi:hypothetical protein P9D39_19025, partial [Heyndrickxia oleronia]|uniref:hypothetical protein n=1 Tax=Heyndrickxia oleronia TaxID=38875 RepID=UPI002DBCD7A1